MTDAAAGPVGVKINLKNAEAAAAAEDILLLTSGQIRKLERARLIGKRGVTIRMSKRQLQANKKHEGGFIGLLIGALSAIASAAAAAAPEVLAGVATGVATGLIDKAVSGSGGGESVGNGLYLRKGNLCARVQPVKGGGLYLTPAPTAAAAEGGDGLFLKHGDDVYEQDVVSHSPWIHSEIPIVKVLI